MSSATNSEKDFKRLGRAFNHLEDLVFFYGSKGALEAVKHLKEFTTESGSKSIRMKWDGNPQIYWGRETVNGPLILTGHNSWSRNIKTSSPEEIKDFIIHQSGKTKTSEEVESRTRFANQFASLYQYFDKATPADFTGFVYADALFLDPPTCLNDVYSFSPNPKSQTCYHVNKTSVLGKRISQAKIMVVGHAFFQEFGLPDYKQIPISDFQQFNQTKELIVQEPIYNNMPVTLDHIFLTTLQREIQTHKEPIDTFLAGTKGLADLKNIIYTYINQTAKLQELDNLNTEHFFTWLKNNHRISDNKKKKIHMLNNNNALEKIFKIILIIQNLKDQIIDQVEKDRNVIWDTNGEGRVRYADSTKQFGNIKLVPRKRWTPA